jgi:uncharacterized protein
MREQSFVLQGTLFVWDEDKARANIAKHGIDFFRAAEVFFDPFVRIVDASQNDEDRDAAIGYDSTGRVLFVVYVEFDGMAIRIISARKATRNERESYDS